jgi:hypothetical protein
MARVLELVSARDIAVIVACLSAISLAKRLGGREASHHLPLPPGPGGHWLLGTIFPITE